VLTTTFTNQNGCDSLIITTTSLLPTDTTRIEHFSCNPEDVNSTTLVLTNQHGCDSVIIESTLLLPPSINQIIYTTCDPADIGADTTFLVNYQGCDSLLIEETILEQINLEITPVDPLCSDSEDGMIIVDTIIGGTGPYLCSLNGSPFSLDEVFMGLEAGEYILNVRDANGCEVSDTIQIIAPNELIVVELGDELMVEPQINQPVDTFFWNGSVALECDTCLMQLVQPLNAARFQITVINSNGCEATDQLNLMVEKKRKVYIPNIFTPNQDGENDFFTIFGGEDVANVNTFQIFDRWGEIVYSRENYQPNDEPNGWDGTFKGKPLNPGVFIFYAEITFIDGYTKIYQGDLTLVR